MPDSTSCQETRKTNLLEPFNQWANRAELDSNENVKTALKVIRPLIGYASRFCDGAPVLIQVVQAVKEHKHGK